jgi:hypothetical protein
MCCFNIFYFLIFSFPLLLPVVPAQIHRYNLDSLSLCVCVCVCIIYIYVIYMNINTHIYPMFMCTFNL